MAPHSDRTAPRLTSPRHQYAGILAAILLGESYGAVEAASTFMALVGTILVSRPPFIFGGSADGNNTVPQNLTSPMLDHPPPFVGTLFALTAALTASCAFIAIRTLKKTHFATVIYAQAFLQVLGAPVGFVATGQSLDMLHWEQALLLGGFWSKICPSTRA